jgi:hypothetical protein
LPRSYLGKYRGETTRESPERAAGNKTTFDFIDIDFDQRAKYSTKSVYAATGKQNSWLVY